MIGKEAVCIEIETRSPRSQKNVLERVQSSIIDHKFLMAVMDTFDLYYLNSDKPCNDCWMREKNSRLTQCSSKQLTFCSDLFELIVKFSEGN